MSLTDVRDRLAEAVAMRETGEVEAAKDLLLDLVRDAPDDGQVNLQTAWAHDRLGLEQEAVPFYEAALAAGLDDDDRKHALLGLGSTYRALGRYPEALATLEEAVAGFPEDKGFQVFHAMALYNNGRSKEAVEALLRLLSETTADESITSYRRAIDVYAEDLDRTWP